jgi:hypothetical protein
MALVATGVVLVGCTQTVPVQAKPPLQALAARCGALPNAQYRLGSDGISGNEPGNAYPLRVEVPLGSAFVVWARYAQRHLAPFRVTGTVIRLTCGVTTAGQRGGPAAVFRAVQVGQASVHTAADDCARCDNRPVIAVVSVHPASTARTPPARPSGIKQALPCVASAGKLVVSHAPFTLDNRVIQSFGYLNVGLACSWTGFPTIRLYDQTHRLINAHYIDGDTEVGTGDGSLHIVIQHLDETVGMNIESPTKPPCLTARSVSASFGGGTTPLTAIDIPVCGQVYVTPIFR